MTHRGTQHIAHARRAHRPAAAPHVRRFWIAFTRSLLTAFGVASLTLVAVAAVLSVKD